MLVDTETHIDCPYRYGPVAQVPGRRSADGAGFVEPLPLRTSLSDEHDSLVLLERSRPVATEIRTETATF